MVDVEEIHIDRECSSMSYTVESMLRKKKPTMIIREASSKDFICFLTEN